MITLQHNCKRESCTVILYPIYVVVIKCASCGPDTIKIRDQYVSLVALRQYDILKTEKALSFYNQVLI